MEHRAVQSVAVVITAAGASRRMGGIKKEYQILNPDIVDERGKPLTVLGSAVQAFVGIPQVRTIVITVPPNAEEGEAAARKALPAPLFLHQKGPEILFVPGGSSRRQSVHHALSLLETYQPSHVLIHDGARPWVSEELIRSVLTALATHPAVIPVVPLVETPKIIDGMGHILQHLRRATVVTAQTPQGFAFPEILRAHEQAREEELYHQREFTDDAEVWGTFVGPVHTIPGSSLNRKITFPEDLP
ncbi:MAG: 2-C-methyl-D-erythritol 4-phosphate cytidylyltransferase [Treponemataceae bacterium]|nr:2-C-methyl-D-erythritol 4-phosphate cytidylyltransferase [Treponemataceae bacterium]